MTVGSSQGSKIEKLDNLYAFKEPRWLELALTHKSFANEKRDVEKPADAPVANSSLLLALVEDNERLEFLGDAVLSTALSARLMREFPMENEGALSKRRASLVNEERLASLALDLGLQDSLRLGKGEVKTGGAAKPRILACGLEALIGAIFFDSGYSDAERVVNELFNEEIRSLRGSTLDFERDYKTRLQEWSHEDRGMTPTYVLFEEFGPAHNRSFRVSVSLGAEELAHGEGKSKKAAEQEAARLALVKVAPGVAT